MYWSAWWSLVVRVVSSSIEWGESARHCERSSRSARLCSWVMIGWSAETVLFAGGGEAVSLARGGRK